MTLTQYKKIVKSLSRDELENHLFSMFKDSKAFKDIESSCWSEESGDELLSSFQKKLERVFWKDRFSLGECKAVLKEALSRTVNVRTQALMHLAFASEAARLSAAYGDFGNTFYNALCKSAEKFLNYCKTDLDFFEQHEDEFKRLINDTSLFGYGISDDLEYMLEDVRDELGCYDEEG